MNRYEKLVKEREVRKTAQRLVLYTVNEWRSTRGGTWSRNLTMHEIDKAICIARRRKLVDIDILRKAGYKG